MIRVRGAHAHNLRHIDLDLGPGTLVVLQGPSGSGKSSLALDVLHAESRRRLLEVLRIPGTAGRALPPIPVDRIDGLPPTIAVAPDVTRRSDRPLLDASDLGGMLRGLLAEHGELICPESSAPLRAWTTPAVLDDLARLPDGTRLTIGAPLPPPSEPTRLLSELRRSGFARIRLGRRLVRLDDVDVLPAGVSVELVVDRIKWSATRRDRLGEAIETAWQAGRGVVRVDVGASGDARAYSSLRQSPSGRTWPDARPEHFDPGHVDGRCQDCAGTGCEVCDETGLGALARHTRWNGWGLRHVLERPVAELRAQTSGHADVPHALEEHLATLADLALDHLPLGRSQRTVGRGEWRRFVLARALHLAVSPRLVVVDEPLSGLDSPTAQRVCSVLRACADDGATVVVIEHRPEVHDIADRVVAFGPGGGPDGGRVVSDGPAKALPGWPAPCETPPHSTPRWTARHPRATGPLRLAADGWTVLTGPSGSGTSSLATGALAATFAGRALPPGVDVSGPEPRLIEPSVRTSAPGPRSCVATAAGIWTPIRTLLTATKNARVRGLAADAFTFNRATGWCPSCEGMGARLIQFGSLAPVREICGTCHGGRLRPDLDDITWRGHSPRQLMDLDIGAARTLFSSNPRVLPVLEALVATGLGHLPLGRPMSSLSSGERRRFEVALAMARLRSADRDPRPTLVVLDQPDAGLDDCTASAVATWLASTIAGRGTLLTVAHHPALIAAADHVVVLPPRATP